MIIIIALFISLFSVNTALALAVGNVLTANTAVFSGNTINTATYTPAANLPLLIGVDMRFNAVPTANCVTIGGSHGLSWQSVGQTTMGAGSPRYLAVFRAGSVSPTAGFDVIDISACGATGINAVWSVVQFTGANTTGTNGSGAFGLPAINSVPNSNTLGLTITGSLAVGDITFAFFGTEDALTISTPANWAILGTVGTSLDVQLRTDFSNSQNTTPIWNVSGSNRSIAAIGLIVKAGGPPDTTPPTVPTGLTLSVTGSTTLTANWNISTDDSGISPTYLLERCSGNGCSNFVQVATPITNSSNEASLIFGTSYSYRVRAIDGSSNMSGFSSVVTAQTLGNRSAQIGWTDRDNNPQEDGFAIEMKLGTAGTYASVGTVGANVTSFTHNASPTSKSANGSPCYRVKATSVSLGDSPYANEVCTSPVHLITVIQSGTGSGTVTGNPVGINCGATCVSMHTDGVQVTLTAAPQSGSFFIGWSGGGCSGTGSCIVNVNGADINITAQFSAASVPPANLKLAGGSSVKLMSGSTITRR